MTILPVYDRTQCVLLMRSVDNYAKLFVVSADPGALCTVHYGVFLDIHILAE